MYRLTLLLLSALALAACSAQAGNSDAAPKSEAARAPAYPLQKGRMIVYVPGKQIPMEQLPSLGPPGPLGGELVEGSIEIFARVDYSNGPITGGIFAAKGPGIARVTMANTEHATILYGEVTLIDETGARHLYREGDSYLIKQGSVILWDQKIPLVQKSFYNIVEK